MKKTINIKKKLAKKQDKVQEKVCIKDQISLNIRRLAINNCQVVKIDIFRNIFLDPSTGINRPDKRENAKKTSLDKVLLVIRHTFNNKKKNKTQVLARQLIAKVFSSKVSKKNRPSTPLSVVMDLIWPDKQRVKLSNNVVKIISLKKTWKV